MIRKALIPLASVSLFFLATSCTMQTDGPGDTAVETRTPETEKAPGNILAEGRVKSSE